MNWILAAGIFALVGGALGCYLSCRSTTGEDSPPPAAARKVETYGHPSSPVSEVKERLPSPPSGFLWELTVERQAGAGHRFLALGLLELATGTVVAQNSWNLDWRRRSREAWATFYARYPALKSETLRNEVVLPVIDWALAESAKRSASDGPDHHEVIA